MLGKRVALEIVFLRSSFHEVIRETDEHPPDEKIGPISLRQVFKHLAELLHQTLVRNCDLVAGCDLESCFVTERCFQIIPPWHRRDQSG